MDHCRLPRLASGGDHEPANTQLGFDPVSYLCRSDYDRPGYGLLGTKRSDCQDVVMAGFAKSEEILVDSGRQQYRCAGASGSLPTGA